MIVESLHPKMTLEHLGYIPTFLLDNDPRPMKEQINERYVSGWFPMSGMTLLDGRSLHYPGDPLLEPIARIKLEDGRGEFAYFYEFEILAIIQPDGSFEASRLD